MAVVVVNKPDTVSMSGNLKPFVLQSSTAVAFTLEVGGSQVLNETYYPGNGNLIEIDLREVVESYLLGCPVLRS